MFAPPPATLRLALDAYEIGPFTSTGELGDASPNPTWPFVASMNIVYWETMDSTRKSMFSPFSLNMFALLLNLFIPWVLAKNVTPVPEEESIVIG